jgi:hypothetical protein
MIAGAWHAVAFSVLARDLVQFPLHLVEALPGALATQPAGRHTGPRGMDLVPCERTSGLGYRVGHDPMKAANATAFQTILKS